MNRNVSLYFDGEIDECGADFFLSRRRELEACQRLRQAMQAVPEWEAPPQRPSRERAEGRRAGPGRVG